MSFPPDPVSLVPDRFSGAVTQPQTGRDPRRAYRVVDDFEAELADYTGAPYAVTVDSCTNAIYAMLTFERVTYGYESVGIPTRTYVGVLQAATNAGYDVEFWEEDWQRFRDPWYCFTGYGFVVDSARYLARDMYAPARGAFVCLSFHAAKQLPLGRGGAVLTDDQRAAEWLMRFRTDGRAPGDPHPYATFPAAHIYMPPDTAARGLWILSRWNDAGYSPPPLPREDYPDLSKLRLP